MPRLRGLALSALLALGAAPALPAQTPTHLGVPQYRLFTLRFYRAATDPVGGNQYSGLQIWDGAGNPMTFPASGMAMVITDLRVTHQGIPYTNGTWEIAEMNQNTNGIFNQRWQLFLPQTAVAGGHHAPMTSGLVFSYPMKPVLSTNMDQTQVANQVYAYGYFVPVK
ncbi:MAG: hypothetical protein U0P81_06490 [Holophagaceae bacterium]